MKSILKKVISIIAVAAMIMTCASGCGKTSSDDGKIKVSIGDWPNDTEPEKQKNHEEYKTAFEQANPDVTIVPDTYKFDTKTFMVKAGGKQLPNAYKVAYTETKKVISRGLAADITDELEELGWKDKMNTNLAELVTDDEGRIYGFAVEAYAQGLYINKALFREAGLVNEDGSIKYPKTLEEMAEYSQTIHDKTGRAGFVIPTTDNCGGWHFLNIAWDFGTSFMEEKDGKWVATFDSDECKNAMQYVKDLKWKYNALPESTVINQAELQKIFATGQAAMAFMCPPSSQLATTYGMNKDDIMVVGMPEGPAGRYSQMGGSVWMFTPESTPEQIKTALKWFDFIGYGPTVTDVMLENQEKTFANDASLGAIITERPAFRIWQDADGNERREAPRKKYCNVNMQDYANYYSFEGVTIREEEPVCGQELYSVLDKCIQEVITNEKADVSKLISEANAEFQTNYLDKQ